ncbi:MAG: CHAD domain-containing protein, partial [Phycisphaerales bacterium]|nr:CHAD domain-containing protein [Phycisphaerales bacterium]
MRPEEGVEVAIRRLATEQIDRALVEMDDADRDVHAVVHQVRKRCKKIRAVIRMVKPVFRTARVEEARFRDAGRRLGGVRDASSMVDCLERLGLQDASLGRDGVFERVRLALHERRSELEGSCRGASDLVDRLGEVRASLCAGRSRVTSWTLETTGGEAIRAGMERTYRRSRDAMRQAFEGSDVEVWKEC